MSTDDIHDWFESGLLVRTVDQPYVGRDIQALWRCKICAALVEGDYRAAHRYWHLSSREVDQ